MREVVLLAMVLAGCERGDRLECPQGTEPFDMGNDVQACKRPDWTFHGPVTQVIDGERVFIGELVDGKRHGKWRPFKQHPELQASYDHGTLDGRMRIEVKGTLLHDCGYRDGLLHGRCEDYLYGHATEYYEDGVPVGVATVERDGQIVEVREYGEQGVLFRVNGRAVPPGARVLRLLDGTELTRAECRTRGEGARPCLLGFDAHQRCALEAPAQVAACERRALEQLSGVAAGSSERARRSRP